jgi:H+/Cl- antiporter ClcA
MGGSVVGPLIFFFAREAKGHGVPEVMEAVAMRSGFIRKRVVGMLKRTDVIVAYNNAVLRRGLERR